MLRYVLPLLAAGVVAVAQSPNPARFSVLSAGSLAGKAVQAMRPDGTTDVEYFFNDRGRGPEVHGHYRFDTRGFPTAIDLTGRDYINVA